MHKNGTNDDDYDFTRSNTSPDPEQRRSHLNSGNGHFYATMPNAAQGLLNGGGVVRSSICFFIVPLSIRFTLVIVVSQLGAGERSPLHDRGRSRQVGGSRVEFCCRIVARNGEIIRNVSFCDAASRLVSEVKRLSECDLGSSFHN